MSLRGLEERDPGEAGGRVAWKVGVILVAGVLLLTVQEYLGPRSAYEWMPYDLQVPMRHGSLEGFAWWTMWSVAGYLLVPWR
jgi:hypothetical protein